MKYETNTVVVVAPSVQAGRDAIRQYGVCDVAYPADDQVTVIPTIRIVTSAVEALNTPPGLPWTQVDEIDPMLRLVMLAHSGAPSKLPDIIKALNDEYAINPRRLTGA